MHFWHPPALQEDTKGKGAKRFSAGYSGKKGGPYVQPKELM